jgi:flagellin
VQANNSSLGTAELGYLDAEQSKLATTLGDVLDQASFNGIDLIDTNASVSLTFQVGADNGDTLLVSLDKLSADVLSVTAAGVNLAATSGTAEVAHIDVSSYDTTNSEVHNIVIDGTTYTTASSTGAAGATGKTNLAAALQTALQTDSGDSSITVAYDSGDGELDITWTATGQHEGDYSLSSATNTTAVTATAFATKGTAGIDTASLFITTIDSALDTIASDRADLGAIQAQMESTVRNLSNVAENTAAAQGRIMDTDYAAETANLTKAQILQQAATSILAQANSQPQSVLSLLQ